MAVFRKIRPVEIKAAKVVQKFVKELPCFVAVKPETIHFTGTAPFLTKPQAVKPESLTVVFDAVEWKYPAGTKGRHIAAIVLVQVVRRKLEKMLPVEDINVLLVSSCQAFPDNCVYRGFQITC